ncbi:MAG: DnaD domain protein [Candidatus Onthovivens sp.]|nr:DnaD domain protein [Candidatus Onthovivens sp.]
MKFESSSALDFNYLVLQFYKIMNLGEREVMVILMINHLLKQENDFITSDLLALKMKLSVKEIDESLSILFEKGYLEYIEENGHIKSSLRNFQIALYKAFERTIFTEDEIAKNKEAEEKRYKIFEAFQDAFKRNLSPIEVSRIDNWIEQNIDTSVILNSLKDAENARKLNINYIDTIILNKLRKYDREGNEIK